MKSRGSADQQLGDLDAVERRALAQLISRDPEVERIWIRDVFADTADEAVVLSLGKYRHRILIVRRIVNHAKAGKARERLARPGRRHLRFGLRVHGDRMSSEDGHAHGCGRYQEVRSAKNLAHLVDQLHLLARVAAFGELVDMRDDVEGYLMLEELGPE